MIMMDVDNSGNENASSNTFHTPRLSSAPSFSVSKPSPRAELRKQIVELSRKIAQTETQITSLEVEIKQLEEKRNMLEVKALQSNDSQSLISATSVSQKIVPGKNLLVEKQRFLNSLYNRLSDTEKKLANADEEGAKRVKASLDAMLSPVLSNEGPDIAYIPDNDKFLRMQTWLHQERVLLLQSPPGTGKTTFAWAFVKYLRENGFRATYLNASVPESTPDETRSMDDIWRAAFESELTFSEMCKSATGDHIVVVDEIQGWYPFNTDNPIAQRAFKGFWADVKLYVRPVTSIGIRLLCLSGYGDTNLGSIATPLGFQDPEDPETHERQPLGLDFLRLNRISTNNLVDKFINIKTSQGKKAIFDSSVCDLIYEETNGHVGAIRALLHHLVSSDRWSKQHVLDFVRRDIYQADMVPFRAFFSISQTVIGRLSPKDLQLLTKCIVYYKRGIRKFEVTQLQIAELVKLGIFIKIAPTGVNEKTKVAFPSPLHFDLLLYNLLHRPLDLSQSRDCFYRLLKELVLRMSPKVLQDTVTDDDVPSETHWQNEVCRAFQTLSDTDVRTSVGREFNQLDNLDLYVDGGLQWGIEVIRDGSQERLDEHVGRFRNPNGQYQYRNIPLTQYAVLNFTCFQPDAATLDRYDENVYHLVYDKTYTKVIVYRKGRVAEDWNLIGYQGRTEY